MSIELTIEEIDVQGLCSLSDKEGLGVIVKFKDEANVGERFISYKAWWQAVRFKRGPKPRTAAKGVQAQ